MAAKQFHRFTQLAGEKLAVREKSDRLTESLSDAEKKMEGIKNGCLVTCKRLHATHQGSGSTLEKHQRKVPQFSLGNGMIEAGQTLGPTVFGNTLRLVGQGELEISLQVADYEQCMEETVIRPLNIILEEELKKLEKSKKKLSSSRVDMDSIRNRYQSLQDKFSPKAESIKSELDQAINRFEQCQDAYATNLFTFLSRERDMAALVHKMVVLQISRHKQALGILQGILPHIDKELDETNDRPVYGQPLSEHLQNTGRTISYVIEECCLALREKWMDTEGLFRLAASAAKLKLLKYSFDAGCVELNGHDPHTIAGALKQYLRELPAPLLTFELCSAWTAAAGIGDEGERLQRLWTVKENLPKENLENLKYLMFFLSDLSEHHEETKMNAYNIAIVIGPNLLWSKVEGSISGLVGETALYTRIVECFIKHPTYFFGEAPSIDITPHPVKQSHSHTPSVPPKPLNLQPSDESTDNNSEVVDFACVDRRHSNTSEEGGENTDDSPTTSHQSLQDSTHEKPTPRIRRSQSSKKNEPSTPTPTSSPKTPTGRPTRPAPQPPPRPKPRHPPPSPPAFKDKIPSVKNGTDKEETVL